MLNIVMTFAQLERETTAERVRDNYHHRVSLVHGRWSRTVRVCAFQS